jgi:anti-sigma factor RsiW
MMDCPDYRLQVSMFIDDELPEEDRRTLFRHVGECDACWTFFRRIEMIRAGLVEERRGPPGTATRPLLQRRISIPVATFVLAAFLALMAGVLFTLSIVVSERHRTIDGAHDGRGEVLNPQAVLSGPVQGTKP